MRRRVSAMVNPGHPARTATARLTLSVLQPPSSPHSVAGWRHTHRSALPGQGRRAGKGFVAAHSPCLQPARDGHAATVPPPDHDCGRGRGRGGSAERETLLQGPARGANVPRQGRRLERAHYVSSAQCPCCRRVTGCHSSPWCVGCASVCTCFCTRPPYSFPLPCPAQVTLTLTTSAATAAALAALYFLHLRSRLTHKCMRVARIHATAP